MGFRFGLLSAGYLCVFEFLEYGLIPGFLDFELASKLAIVLLDF